MGSVLQKKRGLPRTFVGFSSTDLASYFEMQSWKDDDRIDFDFANCQIQVPILSSNDDYVRRKLKERLMLAKTYLLLIGSDTRSKHKFVRWEAGIAIEKECRIIGVNLDGSRVVREQTCPPILRNIGAVFVPFHPVIIKWAIDHFERPSGRKDYAYSQDVYNGLGYRAV